MKIKGIALLLVLKSVLFTAYSQEAVYFFSADSNRIDADIYRKDNANPYIILCPQEGADRREYRNIAPRLLNLNYNCLVINIRHHGKPIDAIRDIQAAIRFLKPLSNRPVILWGSSFSASLCILAAIKNPGVKGIVALNPGEYLLPGKSLKKEVAFLKQPILVFATTSEFPYIQDMLSAKIPSEITLFTPEKKDGVRGTQAFTSENPDSAAYWFALTLFFKKLGS